MSLKKIFYDFEVLKKFWMVVFIDFDTRKRTIIHNDRETFVKYYNSHKDAIFIGYNSRGYDQFIYKGILNGQDPYLINKGIIEDRKKGYELVKNFNKHHLNNFDIQTGFHSLKQLEGFMGSDIQESSVPFDLSTYPTIEEIDDLTHYCIHDVEQTIEVFNNLESEFSSHLMLIDTFNLDMQLFNKTKAQLAACVLGAKKQVNWMDTFDISIPDTVNVSKKYQYIVDWYKDEMNRHEKQKLDTLVANVPHTFRWGGLHGALSNYMGDGEYVLSDIASMYPAIMIEYDYLSRNVKEKEKYRQIRDKRIELKKAKNPAQLPMKIVLNSTYGATKDQYNQLYDPLMANNVCVAGQLLLLDLIEKIEPYGELIQSNTDGILVKVNDKKGYFKACENWCKRSRLDLEHDEYVRVIQKDVNNYIIIDKDGKYKSKGAYVKKLSEVDNDLPIVNKSLLDYFIHGVPVEDTINKCADLKMFQKIVKKTGKFYALTYGDKILNEKVMRVFASTREFDQQIRMLKLDKVTKQDVSNVSTDVDGLPVNVFIDNGNVNGETTPDYLNRSYYIKMANSRIDDFINGKEKRVKSDIKGVTQPVKDKFNEFVSKNKGLSIYQFFTHLQQTLTPRTNHVIALICTDYFNFLGNSKYIYEYYSLLHNFWDSTNKKITTSITMAKINKLKLDMTLFNTFGVLEKYKNGKAKKFVNVNIEQILSNSTNPLSEFTITEKLEHNSMYKELMDYHTNLPEHRCVVIVEEILDETTSSPTIICYSIGSGKRARLLVNKLKLPKLKVGALIKAHQLSKVPKKVFVNGRFIDSSDKFNWKVDDFKPYKLEEGC